MAQQYSLHTHLFINVKLRKSSKISYVSFKFSVSKETHSSYTPLLMFLFFETLEQRCLRLD